MSLTLMFITNDIDIAKIAQEAGVDRIWVDMEWIGKDERQKGLNTVKSHHTVADVQKLRPFVTNSKLMVRINPIHSNTKNEIEEVINAGADIIMLPMFKTVNEVEFFLKCVHGRTKTILLIETIEAASIVDDLVKIKGIDEFHIGLNDLSLAMKKPFMFDLLRDGVVDEIIERLKISGKPYGFGGIARIGKGMVPSEYVIKEHYRLGSSLAILSRSFANVKIEKNLDVLKELFIKGVRDIREEETKCLKMSQNDFIENKKQIDKMIDKIDLGLSHE
ncbi:MAG: aldolase [Bacilli bacterium]|nr:aldolase [Bacilli bacterium]